MTLKTISLNNFRNFPAAQFNFDRNLTIIAGHNSLGKTNLLESIYCLCYGTGFREHVQDELMTTGENQTNIEGHFDHNGQPHVFQIALVKQATLTKAYFVDRIKKRLFDYGKFTPKVAIFSPSFLSVIDGQPSDRRNFIDRILGSVDIVYKKKLINYETALRKRNKLLEREKNITNLKVELVFWDEYLIQEAAYIVQKRHEFAHMLNSNQRLDSKTFSLQYTPNEISEKRFAETFDKQFLIKKTLIGPQRDTYEIAIGEGSDKKSVHSFGSRSEQRLALFWLLLNELKIIEVTLHEKPLLLLDDVFSELDSVNKLLILKLIKDYQTIVTTVDLDIDDLMDSSHTIIRL